MRCASARKHSQLIPATINRYTLQGLIDPTKEAVTERVGDFVGCVFHVQNIHIAVEARPPMAKGAVEAWEAGHRARLVQLLQQMGEDVGEAGANMQAAAAAAAPGGASEISVDPQHRHPPHPAPPPPPAAPASTSSSLHIPGSIMGRIRPSRRGSGVVATTVLGQLLGGGSGASASSTGSAAASAGPRELAHVVGATSVSGPGSGSSHHPSDYRLDSARSNSSVGGAGGGDNTAAQSVYPSINDAIGEFSLSLGPRRIERYTVPLHTGDVLQWEVNVIERDVNLWIDFTPSHLGAPGHHHHNQHHRQQHHGSRTAAAGAGGPGAGGLVQQQASIRSAAESATISSGISGPQTIAASEIDREQGNMLASNSGGNNAMVDDSGLQELELPVRMNSAAAMEASEYIVPSSGQHLPVPVGDATAGGTAAQHAAPSSAVPGVHVAAATTTGVWAGPSSYPLTPTSTQHQQHQQQHSAGLQVPASTVMVRPVSRISRDAGSYAAPCDGVATMVLDNAFAFWHSKKINVDLRRIDAAVPASTVTPSPAPFLSRDASTSGQLLDGADSGVVNGNGGSNDGGAQLAWGSVPEQSEQSALAGFASLLQRAPPAQPPPDWHPPSYGAPLGTSSATMAGGAVHEHDGGGAAGAGDAEGRHGPPRHVRGVSDPHEVVEEERAAMASLLAHVSGTSVTGAPLGAASHAGSQGTRRAKLPPQLKNHPLASMIFDTCGLATVSFEQYFGCSAGAVQRSMGVPISLLPPDSSAVFVAPPTAHRLTR